LTETISVKIGETCRRRRKRQKKSRETKERRERERRKKTQRIERVSFLHPCVTVRREIITEERERRKTEAKTSKERDEDAELNAGDGRKQRTDGKGLKQTNTNRSAITPSTSLQVLHFCLQICYSQLWHA